VNKKRRRSASLGCITLIAIFFLAVSAFGLAYQARPSYKIEIGSRLDEAYVTGFRTKEPDDNVRQKKDWDGFDYRFTNAESKIDLPGLGSQPLTVTLRVSPSRNPTPALKVLVNEKYLVPAEYLVIPAREDFFALSFPVPANAFADGNLHLKLQSEVWQPAEVIAGSNDKRKLGILLDWVKLEPGSLPNSGFNLIRPPTDIFVPLVISSLLLLLIFFSIGVPPLYAFLASVGAIGGVSYWLVFDRLNLTELLSRDFVRSLFFIGVAVYAAARSGPRIFKAIGLPVNRREAGWLAAIFLFQFIILWGFMSHPQFTSSDLGLNIHLLQSAQAGNLYFPQLLPNKQLAPYPPAFYLLLLPFTNFTDNSDAGLGSLIKVAGSFLQASEIFFIFYLSGLLRRPLKAYLPHRHLLGPDHSQYEWEEGTNWAGLIAAAFYTVSRYPYYIFSQGNYTNLFGIWTLLLFICVTVGTLSYLRDHCRPTVSLKNSVETVPTQLRALSQTMPVNSGTGQSAGVALLEPLFVRPGQLSQPKIYGEAKEAGPGRAKRYFSRLLAGWRKRIWPILAVTLRYLVPMALLVLVFTAHYAIFLFANVFVLATTLVLALTGGREGRREAVYLFCCQLGALLISFLLYYRQTTSLLGSPGNKSDIQLSPELLIDIPLWFWRDLVYQAGLLVTLAVVGGLLLAFIQPDWRQRLTRPGLVGAVLFALTISTLGFAVVAYIVGIDSRFQLYLLPLVTIVAGTFLGRIWRTGWPGMVVVCAIFLFQMLEMLAFWLDRVTYYF